MCLKNILNTGTILSSPNWLLLCIMTLRQYLTVMIFATAMCWLSWGMVIVNVDPFISGGLGFSFFYISLFLALLGTISIVSFFLFNKYSSSGLPLFRYVKRSFSTGFTSSALLVFLLYLQGIRMLNFWNMTIFIIVIALVLSFLLSPKQSHQESFLQHNR